MLKSLDQLCYLDYCLTSIQCGLDFKFDQTIKSILRVGSSQFFQPGMVFRANCEIEEWNQKFTDSIPYANLHEQWMQQNWSRRDNMYNAKMRILNGFLYEDFIAVTTTVEYKTGRTVYCRYFDCERNEIPNSMWSSVFFPLTTVYCPRRPLVKYVSLSFEPDDHPETPPVPLTFRAFTEPVHELAVCVGPLYGEEKKWLQLIEFIEQFRIQDVSMFYFTIFNMDSYTRQVIDEYTKLGLAETTVVQTEYEQLDWQFHLIQVHDCFHRSKYHAKWVVNTDVDERFNILQPDFTLLELLRSQHEDVGEINFQARRIHKTEKSPETFTNLSDVIWNLEALKFNKTVVHSWKSSKSMYRPEKVAVQTYHFSFLQYPGTIVKYIPKEVAVFRHYRMTYMEKSIGNGWTTRDALEGETMLREDLEKRLVKHVVNMVEYLFMEK